MKTRHELIDILKGFAAVCVVLGHAIQRGMIVGFEDNWLFKLIYTFHMPLFILLSGYVLCLGSKKLDKNFLIDKTRKLLYPTIVWSYLVYFCRDLPFVGIKPFIQFPDSVIEYTKTLILHPNYVIWFLYVIYIYILIFYIGNKLPKKYFLTYIASVGVLFFILPSDYFGMYQIAQYFPFFVIGYYLPKINLSEFVKNNKMWIPASLFFVASFYSWSLSSVDRMKYYVMAFSAMMLVYYLAKLIPFDGIKKALALLGKYSMHIYLTQCLFLNISLGYGITRTLTIFIFAFLLSIAATFLTTRLSIFRVILYGK